MNGQVLTPEMLIEVKNSKLIFSRKLILLK
jgi:hypothetical protein